MQGAVGFSPQRADLWVAGRTAAPSSGQYFEDRNPEDDSVYAWIARGSPDDVDAAVLAAHDAFQAYKRKPVGFREAMLVKAAALLERDGEEFVDIMRHEIGSPVRKARDEVKRAVHVLHAAAGWSRQVSGRTLLSDNVGRWSMTFREPVGVVASITPFNVPLGKGVRLSAGPLALGNCVVMLPAEDAPLTALRLARLYHEAGLPPGCFNVITGFGSEIGDALTGHPLVRSITFTGSNRVGAHIRLQAARNGKGLILELGGKNPMLVMEDADLDTALPAVVGSAFGNQGQICMATSRLYLHEKIADDFTRNLVRACNEVGMGDLSDPATLVGPIINEKQRLRIAQHLDDAQKKGATVLCGGKWRGNRCEPTILSNVGSNMICFDEETFGPVLSVYVVKDYEEALALANGSQFGLAASIFTRDIDRAMHFIANARAGMVHVNSGTVQAEPHVPFGGVGESGVGREGPEFDMEIMTEWKWATIQS